MIFPFLLGSRLTDRIFYRDASSALLQLDNQWLSFTNPLSLATIIARRQIPVLSEAHLLTHVKVVKKRLKDHQTFT